MWLVRVKGEMYRIMVGGGEKGEKVKDGGKGGRKDFFREEVL